MKTKTALVLFLHHLEEMGEINPTYSLKEFSEKHESLKIIWRYVHEKFGEEESLKLTIKQSEMENNLLN